MRRKEILTKLIKWNVIIIFLFLAAEVKEIGSRDNFQ